MKMKLNALSLAIAAAGFAATAAQAADVAMFPYVVNSQTVTTIVSVVDLGNATTQRYNNLRVPGSGASTGFFNLHWRLNYKAGANATNNDAVCEEVNRYLSTSPYDIQTVDIGNKFGQTTNGVLFNDPSTNNAWKARGSDYRLARDGVMFRGSPLRGVLFVHNADTTTTSTIYGEAMILEFANGASWGYQAIVNEGGTDNDEYDFDFTDPDTIIVGHSPRPNGPVTPLTIMPPAQVTTMLFVTPINSAGPMLDADGTNIPGWEGYRTEVTLADNSDTAGFMYDRDEKIYSGARSVNVTCVGAVNVADLLGANLAGSMANGGWARVRTLDPAGTPDAPVNDTDRAYVLKLEYGVSGQSFNGEGSIGTFNNGFIMR